MPTSFQTLQSRNSTALGRSFYGDEHGDLTVTKSSMYGSQYNSSVPSTSPDIRKHDSLLEKPLSVRLAHLDHQPFDSQKTRTLLQKEFSRTDIDNNSFSKGDLTPRSNAVKYESPSLRLNDLPKGNDRLSFLSNASSPQQSLGSFDANYLRERSPRISKENENLNLKNLSSTGKSQNHERYSISPGDSDRLTSKSISSLEKSLTLEKSRLQDSNERLGFLNPGKPSSLFDRSDVSFDDHDKLKSKTVFNMKHAAASGKSPRLLDEAETESPKSLRKSIEDNLQISKEMKSSRVLSPEKSPHLLEEKYKQDVKVALNVSKLKVSDRIGSPLTEGKKTPDYLTESVIPIKSQLIETSNNNKEDDRGLSSSVDSFSRKTPASQQSLKQISIFNYEGAGTSSRNHMLLTNHNLMTAHSVINNETSKNGTKKRKRKISVNLQGTRYDIVKEVVEMMGYTVSNEDDTSAYLLWNDASVSNERISEMKSFQRINHFPAMGEICKKDCLARNISKMAKSHPEEFNFVPKTWILPSDYNNLQNYAKDLKKSKKYKIFIAKPANGAQGNGIMLYHNAEKIPPSDNFVVQEYIERPFLIDGFKCDLRIYVLVLSCDPLKVFLFNDGLVRMSTEHYKEPTPQNLDVLFMHLTNYSINKHSESYEKGTSSDSGSKRSHKFLNKYLRKHEIDVSTLWSSIHDVIVKTVICALPHVHHAYRMCRPGQAPSSDSVCFEILGFDILLDSKLKPWLLEVNRSPSFSTDEQIDYDIKSTLLMDALKLVNIRASDKKKNIAAQKAAAQRRLLQPRNSSTETDNRKFGQSQKLEALKELLSRVRSEKAKKELEDRNIGRFQRIFPAPDSYQQEKYAKLISTAFTNLNSGGKNLAVLKEIEKCYGKTYREEELLNLISQLESEEVAQNGGIRQIKGPPPLTAMPSSNAEDSARNGDTNSEDESDSAEEEETQYYQLEKPLTSHSTRKVHPKSARPLTQPSSDMKQNVAKSSMYTPSAIADDISEITRSAKEKEQELVRIVLDCLQEMRIKFPGKTDLEAEDLLDRIMEDWKYHKSRVASYWLVKLDSTKRKKVIDIVRSNVKAKLQHVCQTPDVDSLRLYRIFGKVFNRLLWSHGQGLWNCFSGNSWEAMFTKSTETISEKELACCRRITQLCKDCLLIVYQFACESKSKKLTENEENRVEFTGSQPVIHSPNPKTKHQSSKKDQNLINVKYTHSNASYSPYRIDA